MASFYADPAVGGDGSTTTDDTNPTTGLDNYGYTTRLVPMLTQVVNISTFAAGRATAAATSASEAAASASSALNAPGTNATSTTSVAIATGSKSFTIQTGKAYVIGQTLNVASAANPANFMAGQVTAYDSGTGALTVNVTQIGGSGTKTDWVVSMGAIVSSTLASMTGNAGKFLTNNGTIDSWADALTPSGNLSGLANYTTARANLSLTPGTHVQAFHANLTAVAGLSLVADRLPYANGTGTLALATLTAAGRALLDDADAAAQRVTLGVVIGTNVQAYHANLAAFAGLTIAADKLPYGTGSGTLGLADLSAFARTILDDANASAVRATLSAAVSGANNDITALSALTGAAMEAIVAGGLARSIGSSGYVRLAPDLMVQWGTASVTPDATGTTGEAAVTFGVAFTSACHGVLATQILTSGGVGSTNYAVYTRNKSYVGVNIGLDSNGTPHNVTSVFWVAIGD